MALSWLSIWVSRVAQLALHERVTRDVAAVEHGDAALRQRVPGGLELVEVALGRRRQFDQSRLDGGAHRGEHARVDGVGLGLLPDCLGEAPRAQRVHAGQRQVLRQGLLERPVPRAGGLVDDAGDVRRDPVRQLDEPGGVVGEPPAAPRREFVDVEMRPCRRRCRPWWGYDRSCFPLLLCLLFEPLMLMYPFRSGREKRWRPNYVPALVTSGGRRSATACPAAPR